MNKLEIAALPRATKLFLVSRKVTRSGMRQVFDVFYLEYQSNGALNMNANVTQHCKAWDLAVMRPLWIRLHGVEQTEFNKKSGSHACGSVDEDNRVGGSFYVNGCGFSRSNQLVEDLSAWATGDPTHFVCEAI